MNETYREFGFSSSEWALLQRLLASNANIEKAILYGSRVKGNFREFSDVDISLIGSQLSRKDVIKLNLAFHESLFPYEVDFSIFSQLKNEQLIDHIRRRGSIIYEKQAQSAEECLEAGSEICGGIGEDKHAFVSERGKNMPGNL